MILPDKDFREREQCGAQDNTEHETVGPVASTGARSWEDLRHADGDERTRSHPREENMRECASIVS